MHFLIANLGRNIQKTRIMRARTCPNCQYQYSPKQYLTGMLFRSLGDTWGCPDCSAELRFDRKRRLWVALGFTLWLIAVPNQRSAGTGWHADNLAIAVRPLWRLVLPTGPVQKNSLMLQQPAIMNLWIAEVFRYGGPGDILDSAGVQFFRIQFKFPEVGGEIKLAFGG